MHVLPNMLEATGFEKLLRNKARKWELVIKSINIQIDRTDSLTLHTAPRHFAAA